MIDCSTDYTDKNLHNLWNLIIQNLCNLWFQSFWFRASTKPTRLISEYYILHDVEFARKLYKKGERVNGEKWRKKITACGWISFFPRFPFPPFSFLHPYFLDFSCSFLHNGQARKSASHLSQCCISHSCVLCLQSGHFISFFASVLPLTGRTRASLHFGHFASIVAAFNSADAFWHNTHASASFPHLSQ